MSKLRKNANGILVSLFELVIGILLLISPVGFTKGIITAVGVFLLAVGVMNTVKYFRTAAVEAAKQKLLAKGLVALLAGTFCTFKAHWFIATFPALSILYGAAIFVTGLAKVQFAFDMLRLKHPKWYLGLIGATLSIVCAIVILNNPFAAANALWMFTGISLIVEAVLDLTVLIFNSKGN